MKQVLLGIVVMLLLLVGGGLYYVYSNLDGIVERVIETAGTQAAGSEVLVDGVEVDLLGGRATIRGFTLANPPGYSDAALLRFAELAVALDLANTSRDGSLISIESVTAREPHLLYETRGGTSNLDVVREAVGSGDPAPEAAGPELQLEIGRIDIEDIGATVNSPLLPQPAEVALGDVHLENLSGTPAEIAQAVLRPLLTQLAANAGRIAVELLPEDVRSAGTAVRDAADARLEQAGEAVSEATQGLREGLGGLLRRSEDTEQEQDAAEAAQ